MRSGKSDYKIIRVTPTLSTDAYAQGDVLFVATEIPDAVIGLGGCPKLVGGYVFDKSGKIIGQINSDDIIDIIEEEAEEDLLRLSGVQSGDTFSAVLQTIKSRFSWLLINLFTAIDLLN